MIDGSLLLLFAPTMFLISATPGMCMTLAMTLGMTVGVRRTVWMMGGELLGVALVVTLCGLGIANLMLRHPAAFALFKWAGGAYMAWLGVQLWRSRGALSVDPQSLDGPRRLSRGGLWMQGFVTAIANPKGWAFFLALLPPFLGEAPGFNAHFLAVLGVVMLCETACLLLYAGGGQRLRRLLAQRGNVAVVNRVAGSLMLLVGGWLALS